MFALQCQVVFEGICFGHVLSIACQYMQLMTPKLQEG
jgi:hypothetical protein